MTRTLFRSRLRPLLIAVMTLAWGMAWPLWRQAEANMPLLAAGLFVAACDAMWPAATEHWWRQLVRVRTLLSQGATLLMTTMLYVLLIVPAGLAGRLLGAWRQPPAADSYYQPTEPRPPGHMKRMF